MCPSPGRGETMAMGVIRSVFFSALTLALSACAIGGEEPNQFLFNKKCVAETAKKQSPVNWDRAKVLNIVIRGGVYDPDNIHMKVGEPTILRIANNDNTSRYFIDGEFLDSVALAQMTVGGAKYDRPCISGVVIGAGKKAELRLVPLTAGIYFPEGNALWFLGFRQGRSGYILVKG